MLKGKSLIEYTNLFSHNEYKQNDKIILTCFQQSLKLKCVVMFPREFKKSKISYDFTKHQVFLFFTEVWL